MRYLIRAFVWLLDAVTHEEHGEKLVTNWAIQKGIIRYRFPKYHGLLFCHTVKTGGFDES